MMIRCNNEAPKENPDNAALTMWAELAVQLDNFDEEKVEEIIRKKKRKEKQDKKKLMMVKKPTNIVVINMKKGISLKFKD
ncbi:hypothetical protein AgCh_031180 [Apium graveolens]